MTVRTVPEDHEGRIKELLKAEILNELRKVELFKMLNEEQILKLAESSSKHLYSKGEILVNQGDSGDSLLIISDGSVEVYVSDNSGRKTHLADLHEGDYFGEMSLLTGEPRSASVSAASETEVIVVRKDGLADLLETEPSILEPLSEMLEKRLEDLSGRIIDISVKEKKHKQPVQKDHILSRIRDFFGIR